jgi:hypothetical protein
MICRVARESADESVMFKAGRLALDLLTIPELAELIAMTSPPPDQPADPPFADVSDSDRCSLAQSFILDLASGKSFSLSYHPETGFRAMREGNEHAVCADHLDEIAAGLALDLPAPFQTRLSCDP